MTAIEMDGVTKTFGAHRAVNDLSLQVPRGSVYGFIGPNGSGKTTTLRMIMNIYYPDCGSIRVFGEQRQEACADRVGYLPEERGLYRKMKTRALLRFLGGLKTTANIDAEVERWIERFDLGDWADTKVEKLSKGMSQKVQFISTIVSRPDLLILDEPFTGLDPLNTDLIRDIVLELRDQGTTIIFSTHDMATAERMCDYIFMIFEGKKVLDGTLNSIQDEHGCDSIRVRIEGDHRVLDNLPGVEQVIDHGRLRELRTKPGSDSQETLAAIMAHGRVQHFEIVRPSLHDIFVRIAGPKAKAVTNA